MMKFLNTFRKDENGAVTVDWVVLTAAVVGLAIAAYTTIQSNAADLISTAAGAVDTADNADLFSGDITQYTSGG